MSILKFLTLRYVTLRYDAFYFYTQHNPMPRSQLIIDSIKNRGALMRQSS